MKMIFLFAITFFLLTSCTGFLKSNSVKDFIPGTYISSWNFFTKSVNESVNELTGINGNRIRPKNQKTHTSIKFGVGLVLFNARWF